MATKPIQIDATRLVRNAEIPWIWLGDRSSGVEMKLLRIGKEDGVYTMINRFQPGFQAPKHLHLGEVHALTLTGRWHYLEYDWVCESGDYVYEPPDTIHTLKVPEDNPEPVVVFFTVAKGMDLYDEAGQVFMTQDNAGMEALYRAGLETAGIPWPECILA
jgi:anti-sigma factor ChrR (cupin superfamily)